MTCFRAFLGVYVLQMLVASVFQIILLLFWKRLLLFMQNFGDISYSYNKKITDIRSEILFREAEDDFYYFNKINTALKKLKTAVSLTPNHLKSIVLCADILFVKGNFKKALELYGIAKSLNPNDMRIIASIANCCYSLKKYTEALKYAENALKIKNMSVCEIALRFQILEIMVNSYIALKNYKKAFKLYSECEFYNDEYSFEEFHKLSYRYLREKLEVQKKLNNSGLKIV